MQITISIKQAMSSDDDHRSNLVKTGYWGKEAAGCLFLARDTGRLLVCHRSSEVLEPGTWGTWGGAIDRGETPKQAVLREAREEAGYVGRIKLIRLAVFEAPKFKYHNFLAVINHEFDPVLNWESQGSKWARFGRWPRPLHPGMRFLLARSSALIGRTIDNERTQQ